MLVESLRRSVAARHRLMALPLLQGLSASEVDWLAERLLVTRYLPGDTIMRQGERGDRFHIIVDGKVDVHRQAAGTTTRLATLGPGEVFGEMALLNKAPRSATVRALTAVETYTLSEVDFGELLRHRPVRPSRSGQSQPSAPGRRWPARTAVHQLRPCDGRASGRCSRT